ncbi:hypothetical protein RHMOL_Rhmol05G0180200 [Rhododendron molle]|uniref:Uncharacterized protein n=1 Tax=Rhododendron molle TaxID=49168 RepID=A0ACC0NSG7_RHOML|nr:hypothetical protein RHMOL_Rhmol05G0180200 [Rhododendron molle]
MPPVCTGCKVFGHATSRCPRNIPQKQPLDQGLPNKEMQSVNRGNFVKVIGGSEALDAVTIPVVETYLPKVTEGVIIESDSEGEELNVTSDIPFEVKVAVGELSSSVEVDLVSPPHVTDPAATVDFPSQPVLPEEAVPPDDKADAVKGMLAFQSPQELKSHNNKGSGKGISKKWSSSSKRRKK